MARNQREVEVKLVAGGPTAREIVDDVAGAGIEGFTLSSAGALILHDRYFDTNVFSETERGKLARGGIVFRVRDVQAGERHETLLTVKGTSRTIRGRAIERIEVERPWPSNEAGEVFELLASCGVLLPRVAGAWRVDPDVPFGSTLEALGLVVLQDRTTHRRRRLARRADAPPPAKPSVELSIDRVTFHVAHRYIVHHEIELEALEDGSSGDLDALVEALCAKHPGLQASLLSKLEIGIGLSLLDEEGLLERYVPGDELPSGAFEMLARRLTSGSMFRGAGA